MSDTITPWDTLGIATLPITLVPDALDLAWNTRPMPALCFVGESGIGKSPLVQQWAKKRGFYVEPFHLGHTTIEALAMTMFNEACTSHDFVPSELLVRLNEQAEKCGGAVLFLDEVNRSDKAVLNAFFTLPDDRRIHNFHLHPNVIVVAAMNPSNGTYFVNQAESDPAIRKRLCMTFVVPDLAGWVAYARATEYDPRVVDFVEAQPTLFYNAQARDAGKVFECPTAWEKVSNTLKAATPKTHKSVLRAEIAGFVGLTSANLLLQYLDNSDVVIAPAAVLYEYDKGGRERVKRLLGSGDTSSRLDVLSNLNESLWIWLFSSKPEPTEYAANLAQYLLDLPDEFLQSFFTVAMAKHAKNNAEAMTYLGRVNAALRTYPQYMDRVATMVENNAKLSELLAMAGKAN